MLPTGGPAIDALMTSGETGAHICCAGRSACLSKFFVFGVSHRGTGLAPPGRRITPACAGNTAPGTRHPSRTPDHPRVRGEHRRDRVQARQVDGSPPRARGTQGPAPARDRGWGITPACAGNTSVSTTSGTSNADHPACAGNTPAAPAPTPTWTDHPRMRGEHRRCRGSTWTLRGSPPHARGTQTGGGESRSGHRITPACAGNTQ